AQGVELGRAAELLLVRLDIGQRRKIPALRLRLPDQVQHDAGLRRRLAARQPVFVGAHHRLFFLLLADQLPGGLRTTRAAGQQARARQHAQQSYTRPDAGTHGRAQRPAETGKATSCLHHAPPATRDMPRITAKKPAPPVTISSAGKSVNTITPVIFTVSRPTFSRSASRRFS